VNPTPPQTDRKRTQRERLVQAMSEIAADQGYPAASIAQVIAHAGVSRPTFYDYFTDKDDCFLAAVGDVQQGLFAEVSESVGREPPERALTAAIGAMVGFADAHRASARLSMNETMVCGSSALDTRDRGIDEIAQLVERAHARVAATTAIPDVSSRLVLGGVERLLALRMRHGEDFAGMFEELRAWTRSYELPLGEHRWRRLEPAPAPAPSPFVGPPATRAPIAPTGGSGLSDEEIVENRRQRILHAAADEAAIKGANATTIAAIAARAGVDERALRRLFNDRQEVFAAVHELSFQSVLAPTAGAFFAGESWPERVWEAGRAFVQAIERNPSLAHVSFVEFFATSPAAVERNSELLLAFTVFLQEGYRYKPSDTPPSRLALEAIAAATFETVYREVRSAKPNLPGLLPHATFLDLAPFLGASEANRFIDERMSARDTRVSD
jgi:AcrR family transcriptional regulator